MNPVLQMTIAMTHDVIGLVQYRSWSHMTLADEQRPLTSFTPRNGALPNQPAACNSPSWSTGMSASHEEAYDTRNFR